MVYRLNSLLFPGWDLEYIFTAEESNKIGRDFLTEEIDGKRLCGINSFIYQEHGHIPDCPLNIHNVSSDEQFLYEVNKYKGKWLLYCESSQDRWWILWSRQSDKINAFLQNWYSLQKE